MDYWASFLLLISAQNRTKNPHVSMFFRECRTLLFWSIFLLYSIIYYSCSESLEVRMEISRLQISKLQSQGAKFQSAIVKSAKVQSVKVQTAKVQTSKVQSVKIQSPKVHSPKVLSPKVQSLKVQSANFLECILLKYSDYKQK